MTIQITIIKIEGYGPWTLKLGSDREGQLQIFQANLYSDLQKMFTQILHLDVDNSTKVSNVQSPYEITSRIMKMFANLIALFVEQKAMTFFVGGDNFMVIANTVTKEKALEIIGKINKTENIKLNCGIGIAHTGRKAVQAATEALDTIRNLRDQGIISPIYEVDWN